MNEGKGGQRIKWGPVHEGPQRTGENYSHYSEKEAWEGFQPRDNMI